jgi:hypothetical protein
MPIKVGQPEAWQIIMPASQWQTLQTPITKDEFEVATDLHSVTVNDRHVRLFTTVRSSLDQLATRAGDEKHNWRLVMFRFPLLS